MTLSQKPVTPTYFPVPPILRKRSADSSPGVYLQLISVIQSMALGLFVYQLDSSRLFLDVNYFLQCALILQFIVITWHEYVIGTIVYRWPLGYLDAWIPISLGIAQYYLITTLKGHFTSFSWSVGCFTLVGVFAFLNQHFKSNAYEGNERIVARLKRHRTINIIQTTGFAVLFVGFAVVAPELTSIHFQRGVLGVLNACLVVHQIRGTFAIRRMFYKG